ncbi:MAG: hypothetical protein ACE5EN_11820 [Nitrospinota bacterium]
MRYCRKTAIAVAALLMLVPASLAAAEKETVVHKNRTLYGDLSTGLRAAHFVSRFPGFKKALTGRYRALEIRSDTDFTINIKRPPKPVLLDRYLEIIPVRFLRPADTLACDSVVEAVFLGHPLDRRSRTPEVLYAYSYLICAGSTLLSSDRLMDEYMEKYGNYDAKDYDRNQIVYQNVKGQYEVRVKPVTSSNGKPALVITVTDEEQLKRTYDAWRRKVREAEKAAKAGL